MGRRNVKKIESEGRKAERKEVITFKTKRNGHIYFHFQEKSVGHKDFQIAAYYFSDDIDTTIFQPSFCPRVLVSFRAGA